MHQYIYKGLHPVEYHSEGVDYRGAVMCNFIIEIKTYTHNTVHTCIVCTYIHTYIQVSLIPLWEDQCEWHRMTRMTGPDCAVIVCNLINIHTYMHTYIHT